MNVAAKLAAFAAVLVLCFAAAFGVGAAVGPIDDAPAGPGHGAPHTTSSGASQHQGGAPHGSEQGG